MMQPARTAHAEDCVLIGLRGGRLITRDITPRGVGASLHNPAEASREETLQEERRKATRERIDGPSSGGFARVHTHGEGITRIPHTRALPDPDQARAFQTPQFMRPCPSPRERLARACSRLRAIFSLDSAVDRRKEELRVDPRPKDEMVRAHTWSVCSEKCFVARPQRAQDRRMLCSRALTTVLRRKLRQAGGKQHVTAAWRSTTSGKLEDQATAFEAQHIIRMYQKAYREIKVASISS